MPPTWRSHTADEAWCFARPAACQCPTPAWPCRRGVWLHPIDSQGCADRSGHAERPAGQGPGGASGRGAAERAPLELPIWGVIAARRLACRASAWSFVAPRATRRMAFDRLSSAGRLASAPADPSSGRAITRSIRRAHKPSCAHLSRPSLSVQPERGRQHAAAPVQDAQHPARRGGAARGPAGCRRRRRQRRLHAHAPAAAGAAPALARLAGCAGCGGHHPQFGGAGPHRPLPGGLVAQGLPPEDPGADHHHGGAVQGGRGGRSSRAG